jgi:hypothetical protein
MANNFKNNFNLWRYLINFWSIFVYMAVICDFILDNAFQEFLGPLLAIYVAILAIYASDKEFERWHHSHSGRHPGEIFVGLWTVLVLMIFIADFILLKSYKFPSEVLSTYIVVLGILAFTKKSRHFYEYTLNYETKFR